MMTVKLTKLLPVILLATPNMTFADSKKDLPGDFSATLALTTDYKFRGISQSDQSPAVQGSLDWSYGLDENTSLYLGTWASNVDFNDNSQANSEFDFYGGLTHDYEKWSFNIGAIYYLYPGADSSLNYDFFELQAAATYNFEDISVTGSINYSPENFGESGDAQYYKVAADIPLKNNFSVSSHIAHQEIDDSNAYGVSSYQDWSIGLNYSFKEVDLSLQYIDTNIDESECNNGCSESLVFTVSKSF